MDVSAFELLAARETADAVSKLLAQAAQRAAEHINRPDLADDYARLLEELEPHTGHPDIAKAAAEVRELLREHQDVQEGLIGMEVEWLVG